MNTPEQPIFKPTPKPPVLDFFTKINSPTSIDSNLVENNTQIAINEEVRNKAIDETQLIIIWDIYKERKKDSINDYMVLNRDFVWNAEESKIYIQVENDVLLDRFQTLKMELCDFLRSQLSNYTIIVEAKVGENTAQKVIYSSQDKHNFMIQKFPILIELKARLGLEISY